MTEVAPLAAFNPAEAYHQNYLVHHPTQPYIVIHDLPKLEAQLNREKEELNEEADAARAKRQKDYDSARVDAPHEARRRVVRCGVSNSAARPTSCSSTSCPGAWA